MSLIKLVLMVLLQIGAIANCQKEEGDTCIVDNAPGVCKLLSKCVPVYNEILNGKHPTSTCGFKNLNPIVCCPNNPASQKPVTPTPPPERLISVGINRTLGSMARTKCEEYSTFITRLPGPDSSWRNLDPANATELTNVEPDYVIGGIQAEPMEFPHMALIGYNAGNQGIRWDCGGTLISDRFVLTAAHCVFSPDLGPAVKIKVGDLNLIKTDDLARPQVRNVIERIKHGKYKRPPEYNDIALLKMDEPVVFDGFVRPACLPYSSPDIRIPQDKVVATGWGRLDWADEEGSPELMKVTLNLVDHDSCNRSYAAGGFDIKLFRGIIPSLQICAGGPGKDTCQGDSGGPLHTLNKEFYRMHTVVGVTSLGRYCGGTVPGVYTRVSHYMKWIEDTIWPDGI